MSERSNPPAAPERRWHMGGTELRTVKGAAGPGTLVGYAAVFGPLSEDLGYFRERIDRGAFRDCTGQDVRALVNHDPACLIGRTAAGTCRLAEDEVGLRVEVDLPDTAVGRDCAESVRRGDMDGMSFSFWPDVWEWDQDAEPPLRTIKHIRKLEDVGPVTFPAYPDTSVALRSLEAARAERVRGDVGPPPAGRVPLMKARLALSRAQLPPPPQR